MTTRIAATLSALAVVGLLALPGAGFAGSRTNVSQGLTEKGVPLAMHSYDPVAYFTEGKPVLGVAAHTAVFDGAAYRFSSEENQRAFEKDPTHYVPAYRGFCAYGVAEGAKFDGDPRVFSLVDGRLYLNLNPDIQALWNKDRAGNIKMAEGNWPGIRDKDPAELKM
jgi:YHS domain-containing protein